MMICGRSKSLRTCSLRIMRRSKRWDGMHSRNSLSQKNVTVSWENLKPFFEANPRCYQKFYEAGIPCIVDFLMITPFEYFCGGRSLEAFFMG